MKKFSVFLFLALAALALAGGCNGANDVTGIERGGDNTPTPVTPNPAPPRDPCRQFPSECD